MKKLLLVVVVLVLVGSAAFAQARKGQFGIQTAVIITSTGSSPAGSFGATYMIGF